jgi:hypothetical protein
VYLLSFLGTSSWVCHTDLSLSVLFPFSIFVYLCTALSLIGETFEQGQTEIKRRSLLSSHDDATTLILKSGTSMYSPGYVHNGSFYAKSIFIHPPMHCFSHYQFFL